MSLVAKVLQLFKESGPMSPGDVAQRLGIPKYKALVMVSCLSEMGLLEAIYVKGSYKIYRVSDVGESLIPLLESGSEVKAIIKRALDAGASEVPGPAVPSPAAEAPKIAKVTEEAQASS